MAQDLYVTKEEMAQVEALNGKGGAGTSGAVDMEDARKQWLDHHLAAGEYDKALGMCVEDADYTRVHEAEEAKRVEWFKWACDAKDVVKAAKWAVTDEELAEVEKVKIAAKVAKGDYTGARKLAKTPEAQAAVEADEEAARLEWLRFYQESGEYKKALEYTVTDEEAAAVAAHEDARNEAARLEWLAHHKATGNYSKARSLVVDEAEASEVDAAEEAGRKEWLAHTVASADWKAARGFCVNEEEEAMVAAAEVAHKESTRKLRFEEALTSGKYDTAQKYSTSEDEVRAWMGWPHGRLAACGRHWGRPLAAETTRQMRESRAHFAPAEALVGAGDSIPDRALNLSLLRWQPRVRSRPWLTPVPNIAPARSTRHDTPTPASRLTAPLPRPLPRPACPLQRAAIEAQKETDRLAWLDYAIAKGEWNTALSYAISIEEEQKVKAAEEKAAEEARMEWMKYHAEKGDYKKAMDMAVGDGDATYIEGCKEAARVAKLNECKSRGAYTQAKKHATAAEAVAIDAEVETKAEANRKEWIEYYKKTSDYDNALALCVSPEEEASTTAAFESARIEHLKQQVELGKYAVAKEYAITDAEMQMIEQAEEAKAEESRLEWIKYYKDTHDYSNAEQYVVTDAELADVQQAKQAYLEKCRVTWRDHYTTVGDYDNATKYVVSNAEAAELDAKFEGRRK